MPASIAVRNLTLQVPDKKGSKTLLSSINFEIEEGKFVAVIGASGCGKSTLIKCLAGLMSPTSGSIQFAGRVIEDLNEQLPLAVGYLPQFGGFHDLLTVGENLENAAALRLPKSVTPERRAAWTPIISSSLPVLSPFCRNLIRLSQGDRCGGWPWLRLLLEILPSCYSMS
jgi:ABC-type multidrug transport system ATPase subunit